MVKKLLNNKLFLILFFCSLFQIILGNVSFNGDMFNSIAWGEYIYRHGTTGIYNFNFGSISHSDANYPPFMLLLCAVTFVLTECIKGSIWFLNVTFSIFPSKLVAFSESTFPFVFIFKLFLVLANLGIAYLAYFFIHSNGGKAKRFALPVAALLMLNPALIYGSTLWGQVDIFPIFFILVSLYVLFYKKNLVFSSLLIVTALLFKQTVIMILPIYFLAVLKYFGFKNALRSVGLVVLSLWLSFVPFVNHWKDLFSPFSIYMEKVQFASSSQFVSRSAWNVWILLFGPKQVVDTGRFLGLISYQMIGYSLVGICFIVISYLYWKRKDPTTYAKIMSVIYAFFLISFATVLFLTRLHERHFLMILPFLIILYNFKKIRGIHIFYISTFILANLFFYWNPTHIGFSLNAASINYIRIAILSMMALFLYYCWDFSLPKKNK